MTAVRFLFDTLLQLAMLAVLLRLLMQWARADFRNPVGQAVLQVTNPVLLPMRRLLPAVGRIDTATVLLLLLLAALRVALPTLLAGSGLPPPLPWLIATARTLAAMVLYFYYIAIIVYALLSMLSQGLGLPPALSLLQDLCEPLLGRIRRMIPPLGGLDFSPLWAVIVIQTLLLLLP